MANNNHYQKGDSEVGDSEIGDRIIMSATFFVMFMIFSMY